MKGELRPWLDQEVSSELRRLLEAARRQEPGHAMTQRVAEQLALAEVSGAVTSNLSISIGAVTGSGLFASKLTLVGAGVVGVLAVVVGVVGVRSDSKHDSALASGSTEVLNQSQIEGAAVVAASKPVLDAAEPSRALRELRNVAKSTATVSGQGVVRRASKVSELRSYAAPNEQPFANAPVDPNPVSGLPSLSQAQASAVPPNSTHRTKQSQGSYIERSRAAIEQGRTLKANGKNATSALAEALRILDEYDRQYPEGKFRPEALQLRMRTNTLLGQQVAASSAAKILARDFPSTPEGKEAREFLPK